TSLVVLTAWFHRPAFAQPSQPQRVETGIAVTVEMFCSETKLRTGNARIRWTRPRSVVDAGGRQSLEATVYKDGFDKGLMVTLPITQATPNRPVAAVPAAQMPAKQQQLRAFQIRVIEIEQPRTAAESAEMGVVVENLEPGMYYTWRLAIDAPSGRIVSSPTTEEAPTCTADFVRTPGVQKRKK